MKNSNYIPTYKDCVEMSNVEGSPFYETKMVVDGYDVSVFNYRLAQWSDFKEPLKGNKKVDGHELRGITFVFDEDGSYDRFLLLQKFFNLNQVPDSMYSVVKDYKIKNINNKEDGSVATFIKLPNGKIVGKTKGGFDNDQCFGINKIYKTNKDVNKFVNWALDNDIVPVFEYVGPTNRVVIRYSDEKLILLRLRNNKTGEYLDINDYLDKLGNIEYAKLENEKDLDTLIKLAETEKEKEGWVIEFENGFFIKIKTLWYSDRHGFLTEDIYKENVIIKHILDDKIDDVLGQIPEDEEESHNKINRIISIIKSYINKRESEINKAYKNFINSGMTRKEYAINHRKGNINFHYVVALLRRDELKNMSKDEYLLIYDTVEDYEESLESLKVYNLIIRDLKRKTSKLEIARKWLKKVDPDFELNI